MDFADGVLSVLENMRLEKRAAKKTSNAQDFTTPSATGPAEDEGEVFPGSGGVDVGDGVEEDFDFGAMSGMVAEDLDEEGVWAGAQMVGFGGTAARGGGPYNDAGGAAAGGNSLEDADFEGDEVFPGGAELALDDDESWDEDDEVGAPPAEALVSPRPPLAPKRTRNPHPPRAAARRRTGSTTSCTWTIRTTTSISRRTGKAWTRRTPGPGGSGRACRSRCARSIRRS